jgi:hypothetical protein
VRSIKNYLADRVPSVFEGRAFKRYTFNYHSEAHPANHFGQYALILYQVSSDLQLRSRLVHDNFVEESKKMKHSQNSLDAASLAPPSLSPLRFLRATVADCRKARVRATHQFDGFINRIAERVFPCGRSPAIQLPPFTPH